jgi:hypothetical protein
MKWTENGIEFEGTPEEYLALHKPVLEPRQPKYTRAGKRVTVVDLAGENHLFVRVKDAASYIATTAQRNVRSVILEITKRTSDTVYLKDYMASKAPWNPEIHQEVPSV